MKLIELFSFGKNLPPVEQQDLKGEIFEQEFASITENRMSLWKFGSEFSKTGTRFLLGVCPSWNLYDLYLLDCINYSLSKNPMDEVFEVFDIDRVKNLEDLQKIFGNIKPMDTPTFGIWEEGILTKSIWGWDAKNFLIDRYNFVWQPPKVWLNQ